MSRILTACLLFHLWLSVAGAQSENRPLSVPKEGRVGFAKMGFAETGILFTNAVSEDRSMTNRNLLSGSGVALGDMDGDGRCDIYFCRLGGPNALYRNLGGWKFVELAGSAGVACAGQDSTGAAWSDVDGDGDLDLLVNALGGGTRLFLNDGKGKFRETTGEAGLMSAAGSMSLALADVDGNGTLDLYVANFRPSTLKDLPQTKFRVNMVEGRPVVTLVNGRPATAPDLTNRFAVSASGNILEFGEPDTLYLNDGKGRFTPVSWTDGSFLDEEGAPLRLPPRDWGLAVQFHDLNGDGAPDLYVCNDLFTPDRIWINDGRGKFRAIGKTAVRSTSTFSMGVDFADINRDGALDFFVVDMLMRDRATRHTQVGEARPIRWPIGLYENRTQVLRNTLQLGRGDGTFAEAALAFGVEATDWSWGPVFLDVDLDGYEDLLVGTGQAHDFQNMDVASRIELLKKEKQLTVLEEQALVKLYPTLATRSLAFRNVRGERFEEISQAWGFGEVGIGQGMATADLDGDGDLDVVINQLNGAAGLYRNESTNARVLVRLKGEGANRNGIGAKILVRGGGVEQTQEMIAGGRYLSGDEPVRVFAGSDRPMEIEVRWRSGKRSLIRGASSNQAYEFSEASAGARESSPGAAEPPWFEDVTALLGGHRHVEEPFDDFALQPLLSRRLSQSGPGMAWVDIDGDARDDLVVGSGKGGSLTVLLNRGSKAWETALLGGVATRDQGGITSWKREDGVIELLVAAMNYEDGLTNGPSVRGYARGEPVRDRAPGEDWSVGSAILSDLDGDGSLELITAGRARSGRWPEPCGLSVYRRQGAEWVLLQRLEKVGLINSIVSGNLDDKDGLEIIAALDWGTIRIFSWIGGKLVDRTDAWGLQSFTGWWNGVALGDFDGDGRLDLAASNWGRNTPLFGQGWSPRILYWGDLDDSGSVDLIEAVADAKLGAEFPERGFRIMSQSLPFLMEKTRTFEAYGKSTLVELFGERLQKALKLKAGTADSMIFLNRGSKFQAISLPSEAQRAPAFGLSVGDVDGDGLEDLFLAQNFFATHPELPRMDAGRGLWLRGDGTGRFEPLSRGLTGIAVYGESRSSALSDMDGDGRVDLAVSQNGAETKLYRNLRAVPGLRVRLAGPTGNAFAYGAVARLQSGGAWGPARIVSGGGGYSSQDSSTVVLGSNGKTPESVEVRWPGGKTHRITVPAGARTLEIRDSGTAQVKAF